VEFGYFISEEGTKAIGKWTSWREGRKRW